MSESLTASQARLQDDLRGLIRGDVRCDEIATQLYSSDGSPFQERPQGVVWPRSSQDVAAVVQYASEKKLTTHFRGSGTSGVAGAIGSGLVLDFSRYMRRVLQAGDDFVRVQPGAARERVNEQLRATKGRFFAPSAGHVPTSTIGGVVACDVVGPRWLRYGAPHENVLALKVVSASGKIWKLRPFPAKARTESVPSGQAAVKFRRQFLNAALAEANAVAVNSSFNLFSRDERPSFDRSFDDELNAAVNSERADEFGIDLNDGYGVRSFRSDFVRDEYFTRTFGADARDVRDMVGAEPWASALRTIRKFEPWLDEGRRPDAPSRCGYALRDVVRSGFDPTRFFVGSEGTLGAIVEATLATFPPPGASCAAILLFDSTEKATRAVPTILEYAPTLCDLLDSRVVALTRDWDARFEPLLPQASEGALVVEFDAESQEELRNRMDELLSRARFDLGAFGRWIAYSHEERTFFRDLLRKSSCARLRMAPSFQSFPYWEDARLPVESIPDFLRNVQDLFKRERIVFSVGGYVGLGHVSIQPILPYSDEEERRAFALSDQFEELVLSYGGEIGVAKGNGRVRTAVLPKRFPNLFPAFVQIKDAFDPANRLNPDCVVSPEMRRLAAERVKEGADARAKTRPAPQKRATNDDDFDILAPETDAVLRESALHSRSIARRTPFELERLERDRQIDWLNRPKRSQLEFQLAWNPTLTYAPTYQCVGCGHCRIRTPETRMCPTFRNQPDEQSSCRAKANLLRGVFDGDLALEALTREDVKKIADRCIRCHCCTVECPAQVDAPRLAFRLMSAYRAAVGLGLAELFAVRADFVLNVATRFAWFVNLGLTDRNFRWIVEKLLNVAQGRKLPKLESKPYLSRVAKKTALDALAQEENAQEENAACVAPYAITPKRSRRKVALFIDSFANFFDAQLVDATIKLLERNGVYVTIPTRPRASGVVAFAIGDVDRAEEFATRNVSAFRELVRDGSAIVALEPTSAVCIKKEYPYFCDDADAQVVYANTTDVCAYLANLAQEGALDLDGLKPAWETPLCVGYHAPCRSIALSGASLSAPTHAQTLLGLLPNVNVRRLERGCCGFSGFSGFTKKRYNESLRLGARLFLASRNPEIDLCSSECSFCNLQTAQGVDKPVAHALKLLAASYGFLELRDAYLKTCDVASASKRVRNAVRDSVHAQVDAN